MSCTESCRCERCMVQPVGSEVESSQSVGLADGKSDIYRTIGINVKRLRLLKGITQQQLSKATTLGRTSITNMELGRQAISVPTLISLAMALGCSVSDLLMREKIL